MKIRLRKATVNYLQINDLKPVETTFPKGFVLEKQEHPSPEKYLEVYKKIGAPWNWSERLLMSYDELKNIITAPQTSVYFLIFENEVCGFFELAFGVNDAELVYFGLHPDFTGKGLGTPLINAVKNKAYEEGARRLWLHTCDFDSPAALPFYLKSGFEVYKTREAFEKHVY